MIAIQIALVKFTIQYSTHCCSTADFSVRCCYFLLFITQALDLCFVVVSVDYLKSHPSVVIAQTLLYSATFMFRHSSSLSERLSPVYNNSRCPHLDLVFLLLSQCSRVRESTTFFLLRLVCILKCQFLANIATNVCFRWSGNGVQSYWQHQFVYDVTHNNDTIIIPHMQRQNILNLSWKGEPNSDQVSYLKNLIYAPSLSEMEEDMG